MTDKILSRLQQKYPLTPIDAGEFAQLKANGMTFTVQAFHAEGLGHVSVMRAKGFFGLMRMDTLIINPTEIDLPLYSYDRIFAMGNDTLIVELYDTMMGSADRSSLADAKNNYKDLPERDPGSHWYDSIKLPESISKKGKKALTPRLDRLAEEHFAAYLSVPCATIIDKDTKKAKADYYVSGLLKNGGPSTDVFKKALGEEKTAKLFREILFGTK